jgi:16S rRNA G966 N2-methylase RsmD
MADYSGFYGGISTRGDINYFLSKYVAEVVFVRRRRAKDPSVLTKTRRMICTTNQFLLNSPFGKKTLRYKPAFMDPPYNAKAKGLITVWDILMQDWRNIDAKSAVVIKQTSEDSLPIFVNNQEGIKRFALFFNAKIRRMNARQFMDS